jgi:hypothetical protein
LARSYIKGLYESRYYDEGIGSKLSFVALACHTGEDGGFGVQRAIIDGIGGLLFTSFKSSFQVSTERSVF